MYVQTESNTLCARGIGGKQLFEGNGRDTRWIVSDFVRALNEATEVKMAWVSGWGSNMCNPIWIFELL
jgi:hypothetical protein